jgi:hypothetical protein
MKSCDKLVLEDGSVCYFVKQDSDDEDMIMAWDRLYNKAVWVHYKAIKSINDKDC